VICWFFFSRIYGLIKRPLDHLGLGLYYNHPTDPLNLQLKTALVAGAILASPFILYQVWLFISPGMYSNEKKYVWPFMTATVGLFLCGAFFGYHYVLENAIKVLVFNFGAGLKPIITIDEYTGFFLSIILGLGICFELPILIFFLSLFGIVDARFLLRHFRYAIMAIFIVAAIICPMQDPFSMCLFASPMLVLYFFGVGIAWWVHPKRRKKKEAAAV
jgi:sec-independent protein translocase protein TatC